MTKQEKYDVWMRTKQTKWVHNNENRIIEIASVLEPELEQNFVSIDDYGDNAHVIGYFKNLRKAVIGVEQYIQMENN